MDSWIRGVLESRVDVRPIGLGSTCHRAGWGIGPRRVAEHIIHAVVAGVSVGEVGGQAVRCRAGDLLWIPAGVPHRLRQAGGRLILRRLRIAIRGLSPAPSPRLWRAVPQAAAILADACAPPIDSLRLRAALLLLLDRPGGDLDLGDEAWWPAVESWLARTGLSADPISMAAAAGVSPRLLAAVCRRRTGLTPRLLLIRRRCQDAAEALASGVAVAAAGAAAGWHDPFLFSRVFRRHLGLSPAHWARLHSGS
jgi:AraC-like DNA-binding protein